MIVNIPIPDWIVGIILGLTAIAGMLACIGVVLEGFMVYQLKIGEGTYKTKKWVYTRTRRTDSQ